MGQQAVQWGTKKGGTRGRYVLSHLFLEHGADVNAVDNDGDSVLVFAVSSGNEGVVKRIIESGANINQKNHMGITPLMVAANNNQREIVIILLESGAKAIDYDHQGHSVLFYAARTPHAITPDEVIVMAL